MKTHLDCMPCFVRQALEAARLATDDPVRQEEILRHALRLAAAQDLSQPPPVMGQALHRLIRRLSGDIDPYREAKRRANQAALTLYPKLKALVQESPRPFEAAVRVAIAGNIIDMAAFPELSAGEIDRALEEALEAPLDGKAVACLEERVGQAAEILFLADNAGEIVFDRVLIEELPTERTTVVVRGSPVLNDATLEDAEAVGLTEVVPVIGNGSDAPGTLLRECSSELRQRVARATLAIAKGQGNYETLSELDARAFFLFRVKCPVIAEEIGCPVGGLVICQGTGRPLRGRPR